MARRAAPASDRRRGGACGGVDDLGPHRGRRGDGPTLLIGVIAAIACLSADLVGPRRRVEVWCSALTIVAPSRSSRLPLGPRLAAAAVIVLQVIPLARGGRSGRRARRPPPAAVSSRRWWPRPRSCSCWSACSSGLGRRTSQSLQPARSAAGPTSRPSPPPARRWPGSWRPAAAGAALGARPHRRRDRCWRRRRAPCSRHPLQLDGQHRRPVGRRGHLHDRSHLDGHAHHPRRVRRLRIGQRARVRGRPAGRSRAPSLVLSAGDNAYLLAAPPLLDRAIFDPLHALLAQAPMVAALGEHDLAWNDGSAVISALHLPGHQYSVQYGPVQIVVIGLQADSSTPAYANATVGVCGASCPIRFVLVHRPIAADNPIMPILRRRHVTAIIAGHLHRYERHVRAGILQFTVGTGGEVAGQPPVHPGHTGCTGLGFCTDVRVSAHRHQPRPRGLPLHQRQREGARPHTGTHHDGAAALATLGFLVGQRPRPSTATTRSAPPRS